MIDMHVLGVGSTIANLAKVGVVAAAGSKQVVGSEAERVLARAKARAPVRTGELRDSLRAERDPTSPTAMRVGTNLLSSPEFGRPRPYPAFVEFGTSKMPAEPFLRPAADDVGSTLLSHAGALFASLLGRI